MKAEKISQLLSKKSLRNTKARKAILQCLSKKTHPQDVESIQKSFQRRTHTPHLTTIYRELDTLEKNNIIESCHIIGKKEYKIKDNRYLTHCVKCNKTTIISKKSVEQISKTKQLFKKNNNFHILSPHSHIHGICQNCNKT